MKDEAWEKERKNLIQQIKSGKFKLDNNVVFATLDDEIFITRLDFIPMSKQMIDWQLENYGDCPL